MLPAKSPSDRSLSSCHFCFVMKTVYFLAEVHDNMKLDDYFGATVFFLNRLVYNFLIAKSNEGTCAEES